jgi:membrane-associated PAP2 superfamily phosphatase
MRARMADTAEALLPPRTIRQLALGLLLGALAILIEGAGSLDLWLADAMFDFHIHEFPWQHALLTEHFGHGTLKVLLTGLGALPVAAAIWDGLRRGRGLAPWWRLRVRLLALCTVLVPVVVSLLKRASHSHCPWDLERYGGYQPYYRLLEHMPGWVEAGHCLPGGHASSALWLVGLAVFWLPHAPRKAAMVALAALAFGGLVGWMQQMRGAHFFSHTLWSIWLSAAILLALVAAHGAWVRSRSRRSRAMGTVDGVAN